MIINYNSFIFLLIVRIGISRCILYRYFEAQIWCYVKFLLFATDQKEIIFYAWLSHELNTSYSSKVLNVRITRVFRDHSSFFIWAFADLNVLRWLLHSSLALPCGTIRRSCIELLKNWIEFAGTFRTSHLFSVFTITYST